MSRQFFNEKETDVAEEVEGGGTGMGFGWALQQLEAGKRVAREGWNGKGMFLFLVPGSRFVVNRPPLLGIYPEGTVINYHSHVDLRTVDGYIVPWLASQTDILSKDWVLASPVDA